MWFGVRLEDDVGREGEAWCGYLGSQISSICKSSSSICKSSSWKKHVPSTGVHWSSSSITETLIGHGGISKVTFLLGRPSGLSSSLLRFCSDILADAVTIENFKAFSRSISIFMPRFNRAWHMRATEI